MRRALLILAAIVAIAAVTLWVATGRNSGWTKTTADVLKLDEVTGIEGREHVKRFLPGVDFLAGSLALAGVLAGASFIFPKKQTV
jgi:hypothetical protein